MKAEFPESRQVIAQDIAYLPEGALVVCYRKDILAI